MPVFLKRDETSLYVSIGKMDKAQFQDTLSRVKATPGRRPDPDGPDGRFVWRFPDTPETALRLMTALQPVADPEVEAMVREHAAEIAGQLITDLNEDAELEYSQADNLYPYQRAAVDFIADQPKLLLADEMGLGKTVEAVAGIHEYRLRNPASPNAEEREGVLIICPKAVRGTWEREYTKWGEENPIIVDGRTAAKRLAQIEDAPRDAVIIINWESFWRDPVLPALRKRDWEAIIADEAHRAKNRKSHQSKGLRKLQAPIKLALTGTPIMNSPDELWALLAWLYPDAYTSFWTFHNSYVDEYVAGYNRRVMVGVRNADGLRFELKDKLVRRQKTQVLKDLPEKREPQVIEVDLKPAERKLYEEAEEALIVDVLAWIKENEADPEQIAAMPLDRLKALIPNAAARIAKLRQITAGAKIAVAEELIREEPDTPVVAFTWHVDAARKLAVALEKGRPRMKVGAIAGTDDADPVAQAFQAGELDHVVCTIAKGGTGLTLTRSSNPIMVEEDWTPAINDQAIDRCHRIGQENIVTPRVLRCTDTVDTSRVAPRNAFKRAITAQVIGA